MKFCKRYEEYIRGRENGLPVVGLKKLKKVLKRCRRELQSHDHEEVGGRLDGSSTCPDHCPGGVLPGTGRSGRADLLNRPSPLMVAAVSGIGGDFSRYMYSSC